MKHVFVINPIAGSKSLVDEILKQIDMQKGLDSEIYITKKPHDATAFVSTWCKNNKQSVRFYACGGDGTLNEVVNGAVGNPNASVGCFPCGSGNDYVKYYGDKEHFLNVDNLINGVELPVDLIKVEGRYAVNACHFGFDTAVAKTMDRLRHKPTVGGKNAYTSAVIFALLRSMKTRCTVYADGEPLNDGVMLLCTVANGTHVGGSYKCAPRSDNSDGLLEVCLCKPVSRLKFASMISVYKKGEHLDNEKLKGIICYKRAKHVDVVSHDDAGYTLDGESFESQSFSIDVVKHALRFVVPEALVPQEAAWNAEDMKVYGVG